MSFQVRDACYSSAIVAARAAASSMGGSVVTHNGSVHVVEVQDVSSNSISYAFHPVGGGLPLISVIPHNPQECGLLTAQDGLELAWLVVGAWIATYCVMFLVRIVKGEGGAIDYGRDT